MSGIVGEHHVLHSLNIAVHHRPQASSEKKDQTRCRARRRWPAPHRLCINFHLTGACVTTSMRHSKAESQDLRNKLIDAVLGGDAQDSTGHLPQTMIEFSFSSGTAHCSV